MKIKLNLRNPRKNILLLSKVIERDLFAKDGAEQQNICDKNG